MAAFQTLSPRRLLRAGALRAPLRRFAAPPPASGGRAFALILPLLLAACASSSQFTPKSHYPPDPWVKGYSDPDDCLGGEALAARAFALPEYPRRAFRAGAQGWVMLRLDIDATGATRNVRVERSLPESGFWGGFDGASVDAAEAWSFEPPAAPLQDCRVLIRYRFGKVTLGA